VDVTPARLHFLPRWAAYAGLWLLLSSVFASQLFLAGYVTPWPRAFAAEAVYWLSWWLLAPAVFWWCRRLRAAGLAVRVAGLLIGALAAAFFQPLIGQAILHAQNALNLCVGDCVAPAALLSPAWFTQAIRNAGVNLPVYAGFVLAWHATTYYRESHDRQVRAVELESLLRHSQLEALRSQLNPHFLFNSLHSIAELVHQDPKLAEQLIVRLGELLRRALDTAKQPQLGLAEELDFIRGYLEIEQMRLGDRLRVVWEVEPDTHGVLVPSLILQPLVENAIQHGIAATSVPGTLTLRARLADGQLHLEIADSGPGMPPAGESRPQGIGIANTRARLQRLYGERQSFELHHGAGLVVKMRIPAVET
jgi:two-component system, LytTR family, sensor kinase